MKKQILNIRGVKTLALSGLASLMALGALATSTAEAAVPGYIDYLPAWSQSANSCAVDDASTGAFLAGYNALSFRSGSTALNLWAWCHVTNPLDTGNPDGLNNRPLWDGLIAGYTDPDGIGTAAGVKATLYRVSRATGGYAAVAAFDSNAWLNKTTWQEGVKTFTAKLDFLNNDYYVLINLTRTSTAYNPSISGVRIAPVDKIPG
jgi:hypothetical protein